jgi:hypothetical protein
MIFVLFRRFSIIALVLMSLSFSAYRLFNLARSWNPRVVEKNEVVIWENRLHSIKQELPGDVSRVGYLAEWDFPENQLPPGLERNGYTTEWDLPLQYRQIGALNEFRLTKYVLAPIIVEQGSDDAWIIGNFSESRFKPWLQDTIGTYEIKEIGGGIYLIHRMQK